MRFWSWNVNGNCTLYFYWTKQRSQTWLNEAKDYELELNKANYYELQRILCTFSENSRASRASSYYEFYNKSVILKKARPTNHSALIVLNALRSLLRTQHSSMSYSMNTLVVLFITRTVLEVINRHGLSKRNRDIKCVSSCNRYNKMYSYCQQH